MRYLRFLTALAVTLGLLSEASLAVAQTTTVTAAWDSNTDTVTRGYILYYGTSPGSYTSSIDAGSRVETTLTLPYGLRYYFVVRAYTSDGTLGPPSTEASIDLTSPPPTATISASLASQSSALVTWSTSNAVSATINDLPAALSGSTTIAISGSTTFTIVAMSSTGATVSRSATVTVAPPPTAWISAVMISSTIAQVTWATTDAVSATLNGQSVALNGVANVAVSGTATFTIVATSSTGGSVTQSTTVTAPRRKGKKTTAGA